jgi:hypothetical protein
MEVIFGVSSLNASAGFLLDLLIHPEGGGDIFV